MPSKTNPCDYPSRQLLPLYQYTTQEMVDMVIYLDDACASACKIVTDDQDVVTLKIVQQAIKQGSNHATDNLHPERIHNKWRWPTRLSASIPGIDPLEWSNPKANRKQIPYPKRWTDPRQRQFTTESRRHGARISHLGIVKCRQICYCVQNCGTDLNTMVETLSSQHHYQTDHGNEWTWILGGHCPMVNVY